MSIEQLTAVGWAEDDPKHLPRNLRQEFDLLVLDLERAEADVAAAKPNSKPWSVAITALAIARQRLEQMRRRVAAAIDANRAAAAHREEMERLALEVHAAELDRDRAQVEAKLKGGESQ